MNDERDVAFLFPTRSKMSCQHDETYTRSFDLTPPARDFAPPVGDFAKMPCIFMEL